MNNDNLIEIRNKAIQFYQLALMAESGGIDVQQCLVKMKNTSKSLIEILDEVIEVNSLKVYSDVIDDPLFESIYDTIEVNPKMLSKIKDYLETPKNMRKAKKYFK